MQQPARNAAATSHVLKAGKALIRSGTIAVAIAAAEMPTGSAAQGVGLDATPVKARNIGIARTEATQFPRSEGDQAVVAGWPLYRTDRGQAAFNDAMATLKATDGAAPPAAAFKGCADLACGLSLPRIGIEGWLPSGRIWVSPTDYVIIAHSPRPQTRSSWRRRSSKSMRYFVFHEFHNSSRNTDPYDTISSHSRAVFVPLYMSKPGTDAKGRRFVIVVQVAPYDVASVHASNLGSNGPGIEVAKNVSDALAPLQGLAGILVASMIKTAAPHLQVVNHRGAEGLPMLNAYERRLTALQVRPTAPGVALPFVPAPVQRVASVTGRFEDVIARRGASPRVPIAERGIMPPTERPALKTPSFASIEEPKLIEPIRPASPRR